MGLRSIRTTQWAIAEDQGVKIKEDPKTCNHNFDPRRREWFPAVSVKFFINSKVKYWEQWFWKYHVSRILQGVIDGWVSLKSD